MQKERRTAHRIFKFQRSSIPAPSLREKLTRNIKGAGFKCERSEHFIAGEAGICILRVFKLQLYCFFFKEKQPAKIIFVIRRVFHYLKKYFYSVCLFDVWF